MQIKTVVIGLLAIGVMMMIYGFNNAANEKKVDLTTLNTSNENSRPAQWPFIVGAILFIGGIEIAVIIRDKKVSV